MVGVAVNVTAVPWQVGFREAATDTDATMIGFTVMEMRFDVAGFPVAQLRLDDNTQETTSPLIGV